MSSGKRRGQNISSSVNRVLRTFADHTSVHGVPHIIQARSLKAKVFWSIVCIGAFSTVFYSFSILLRQYFSYPKKVNVEIVQSPVPFPSVTVCNTGHLNMVTVDRIEKFFEDETLDEDEHEVDEFFDRYTGFQDSTTSFFRHYPDNTSVQERKDNDMIEVSSRLGLVANVGLKLASSVSVRAEDFIVQCQFLARKCNVTQSFIKHFDSYYFNCFTFDPKSILESGTTQLSGVEYGLSLLLFSAAAGHLKSDNIVPGLTEHDPALVSGQGARVVVHSPETVPLPTIDGYDVPSGYSVTMGVRARENVRIGLPHGNCSKDEDEDEDGAHVDSKNRYTLISCQLKCIQYAIMDRCGCVDNRLPEIEPNTTLPYCLKLPKLPDECAVTDNSKLSDRLACRKDIYDRVTILEPGNMEKCKCYPPCGDIVYDVGNSLSPLPEPTGEYNKFYSEFDVFLENMPKPSRQLYEKLNTTPNRVLSRLNVFIADCNIMKTTESPDYEPIRLVSDVGGQLGLWIGVSVITLVEVVQLVGDLARKLSGYGGRDGRSSVDTDLPSHCESSETQQRTKYHRAADDSDDAANWPSGKPLAKNGSASSLPFDEMTSVV